MAVVYAGFTRMFEELTHLNQERLSQLIPIAMANRAA
jgi:hypothetical protein